MRVFISWSGDRSRQTATALRDWLPTVLQYLKPWMSSEDIAKGARGTVQIQSALTGASYGIVCVTNENVNAPWLNFEAGVLSHSVNVTTFFVDPTQRDLAGPLTDLQRTWFEKDDMRRLVGTINSLADAPLADAMVSRAFDKWWPELEEALNAVLEGTKDAEPVKRSQEDMLEEMLGLLRGQRQGSPDRLGPINVRQLTIPFKSPTGSAAEARAQMVRMELQSNALTNHISTDLYAVESRFAQTIIHVPPTISDNELAVLTQGIDLVNLNVQIERDLAPRATITPRGD